MLKYELEEHLGIKVTDEFYTYINARYMEGDYKDQKDFCERFLGSCEPLIKIESPSTEELEAMMDTSIKKAFDEQNKTENQQELTHNTIETAFQKRKRKDVPPPLSAKFSPSLFYDFNECIWKPYLRIKYSNINKVLYQQTDAENNKDVVVTNHDEKYPVRILIESYELFLLLVYTLESEGLYTDYKYFMFSNLTIDFDILNPKIEKICGALFVDCKFIGKTPEFFECILHSCNFKDAKVEPYSITWSKIIWKQYTQKILESYFQDQYTSYCTRYISNPEAETIQDFNKVLILSFDKILL